MSGIQDYLQKYRSSAKERLEPKQSKKKKKVKHATMVVIDDDDDGFRKFDEDEEDAPIVVTDQDFTTQFKSSRESGWEVVREGEKRGSPARSDPPSPRGRRSPSASPIRKRSPSASPEMKRRKSPSPSPTREGRRRDSPSRSPRRRSPSKSPDSSSKVLKMSDGTLAGLQSAKDIQEQIAKQRQLEEKQMRESIAQMETQETVYRDKSGKKVDLAAQKAEMLAEKRKREAEEEAKMVWGSGIAQKKMKQENLARLEKERHTGFAVYADDEERNEQMKEKVRWGDTMASMVQKTKKKGRRVYYEGPPPPPNRYGIRPGYRWDGVDRSNGWELKLFQAKYQNEENRAEYQRWATEDM